MAGLSAGCRIFDCLRWSTRVLHRRSRIQRWFRGVRSKQFNQKLGGGRGKHYSKYLRFSSAVLISTLGKGIFGVDLEKVYLELIFDVSCNSRCVLIL